jgi:hypothetical protein
MKRDESHPPAGHNVVIDVSTYEHIYNNIMSCSNELQMFLQ